MSTAEIKISEWLEDLEIRSEYGSATLKYDIAAALVEARKMKNLTQVALAKIAGVSQAYIAKLESGQANPTIGRIGAILASIWAQCHISIVPLVVHERQNDTSSTSSANDMSYAMALHDPAFEQPHMWILDLKNKPPYTHSGASGAAREVIGPMSGQQLGSVFGSKTHSLQTV